VDARAEPREERNGWGSVIRLRVAPGAARAGGR